MGHPVTGHPAADVVTPQVLIIEQDRTVVPLSHWISDAGAVARNTERRLQILTPPYSRITFPLELLIRQYRVGQWVVRTPDGSGFVDGVTGRPLSWDGAMFTATSGAAPTPMRSPVRSPGAGSVEMTIETLHPASETLQLGASTVAAMTALTGAGPAGWGTAEPVSQPWSARELTTFCRTRAPRPTSLVVLGADPTHRALGVLTVTPVTTGVLEEFRLTGPARSAVDQDAVDQDAVSVGADLEAAGRVLGTYASELRAIKARLEALRAEAGAFVQSVQGEDDWTEDGDKVDRNNQLVGAVNAAVADFDAAQRRCASAINALYGGQQYRADDGDG
ncbi:MAG: DUF6177 family protein [Pseudonocardiaceae bacterium]